MIEFFHYIIHGSSVHDRFCNHLSWIIGIFHGVSLE